MMASSSADCYEIDFPDLFGSMKIVLSKIVQVIIHSRFGEQDAVNCGPFNYVPVQLSDFVIPHSPRVDGQVKKMIQDINGEEWKFCVEMYFRLLGGEKFVVETWSVALRSQRLGEDITTEDIHYHFESLIKYTMSLSKCVAAHKYFTKESAKYVMHFKFYVGEPDYNPLGPNFESTSSNAEISSPLELIVVSLANRRIIPMEPPTHGLQACGAESSDSLELQPAMTGLEESSRRSKADDGASRRGHNVQERLHIIGTFDQASTQAFDEFKKNKDPRESLKGSQEQSKSSQMCYLKAKVSSLTTKMRRLKMKPGESVEMEAITETSSPKNNEKSDSSESSSTVGNEGGVESKREILPLTEARKMYDGGDDIESKREVSSLAAARKMDDKGSRGIEKAVIAPSRAVVGFRSGNDEAGSRAPGYGIHYPYQFVRMTEVLTAVAASRERDENEKNIGRTLTENVAFSPNDDSP